MFPVYFDTQENVSYIILYKYKQISLWSIHEITHLIIKRNYMNNLH